MAHLAQLNDELRNQTQKKYLNLTGFLRLATQCKGDVYLMERRAETQLRNRPAVIQAAKSAVSTGGTLNTTLTPPVTSVAGEIQALMRSDALLGKFQTMGCRMEPFLVQIPREITPAASAWVGQGYPAPVTNPTLNKIILQPTKVSSIIVLDDESTKIESAASEQSTLNIVKAALIGNMDNLAMNPTLTEVADSSGTGLIVAPASITAQGTQISCTGSSAAQRAADIQTKINTMWMFRNPVLIMAPSVGAGYGASLTTGGNRMFPNVGAQGGEIFGIPVLTSGFMPQPAGSPTGNYVVMLDLADLILCDDGQYEIDVSGEASLQMNNAPSTGAQNLVSLFQTSGTAIRINKTVNWCLGHPTSCIWMETTF